MIFWTISLFAVVCALFLVGKKVRSILRGRVSEKIDREDLNGQVFFITGGNRGIGFETMKTIIHWGGTVVLGVRDVKQCENKLNGMFSKEERDRIIVGHLNLDSFESVRQFVNKYFIQSNLRLDCLINNAHHSGLSKIVCTKDQIEYSYQVNYLSHCLLTLLLIPVMIKNTSSNENEMKRISRIVHVGSRTHVYGKIKKETYGEKGRGIQSYDPNTIYPDTKLMQLLFNKTLTQHLQSLEICITSNYVHPGGLVDTCDDWIRGSEYSFALRIEPILAKIVGTDVKDAANAVMNVVTMKPKTIRINGKYCVEGNRYFDTTYEVKNKNEMMKDEETELWLWENTLKLIGLPIDYLEKEVGRIRAPVNE